MAVIYHTATDAKPLGETMGLWVYNALDVCVTLEVFEAIYPQLNEITEPVYQFALDLQGPILEMTARGIAVDQEQRGRVIRVFEKQLAQLNLQLEEILIEGVGLESIKTWDKKSNGYKYLWNSPTQLQELFYERLGINPIRAKGRITVDRKALEKLRGYFYAEPIILHILAIRDLTKKLGVLRTGIDRDGRIRTSLNIAGTDTGRLASYVSSFGTGTNLQNITGELRNVFVADPGMRMAYVDLEQAESRGVGAIVWNLFQDGKYLDYCESGDLHTNVTKMTWPHMAWTGDPDQDKKLAKQLFYREKSYRDASKTLGHGSNYYGKPYTMSQQSHIPQGLVKDFQDAYFTAFPGIPKWHNWVRSKLIRDGFITSFMGRQRWFLGRRWEEETLRAAIAYEPQGAIADYLNRGMHQVWRQSIAGTLPVQLLLQVHDAIVFQYPEHLENEVVPQVMKTLSWEVPLLHGRSLIIPTEAFVGWNWAYAYNDKKELVNPNGLVPYTGSDSRQREAQVSFMDRRFD